MLRQSSGRPCSRVGLCYMVAISIAKPRHAGIRWRIRFRREGLGAVSSLELLANGVKNKMPMAFDIPPRLAVEMLIEYRNDIAPKIIGKA